MPKFLSTSQVRFYHEYGFLSPLDIMSEDEAAEYRLRLEAAERDYPEEINLTSRNNLHLTFTFFDEIAFHPLSNTCSGSLCHLVGLGRLTVRGLNNERR